MSVIAFLNQKGGTGKSTTAIHFLYWLGIRQKKSVILIDADAQGSSSTWLNIMNSEIPVKVIQDPNELVEQIPAVAKDHEFVIIDSTGGLSEATRAILLRSDLAVVPCQPTGVDLHSAAGVIRLIRQAQSVRGGPPKAIAFLSRAVKGTKLKEEAIELLSKFEDIGVLKSTIHQKQCVADAFTQKATIWSVPGRPATESAREYDNLCKEIMGHINEQ